MGLSVSLRIVLEQTFELLLPPWGFFPLPESPRIPPGQTFELLLFPDRYTKPKGQLPDYEAPVVLNSNNCTVEDFCNKLHRTLMKEFKQ